MKEHKSIPVTILTGFLGAGKTTVLNRIIQQQPDTKFAIIENEYGDIGIDNELVVGAEDDIFEMSNGCICCTLNSELVAVLSKLVNSEYNFDHLIIETTGLAEPDGVAAAFMVDPAVQHYFKLDATICLVDAMHIDELLEEREEAKRQLTFADFIIINKKSEIETTALQTLQQKLSQINTFAGMECCDYGQFETNILALNAYDANQIARQVEHTHHHHHHDDDDHNHHNHHSHEDDHHHHHHSDIVTHSFIIDTPLDILKFRHWLNVLLMIQGQYLYRIKGIVNFQYQEHKTIVQSVKKACVFQQGEAWTEGEEQLTKIVFIGKHLKREILEKQLKHCYFKE
jgi:G3E family GTPase